MKHKGIYIISLALLLTGCSFLPASGPYSGDIGGMALKTTDPAPSKEDFKYAKIDLTQKLAADLRTSSKSTVQGYKWPATGSANSVGLSVGDTVAITIYESQSGGLFIPTEAGVRPGNFVTIPTQVIERDGVLSVPYAGNIEALGKTTSELAAEITEKLGARAIEPQVVVSVTDRIGAEVSVVGDVEESSKFTLGLTGERILDAIARAGGPKFAGYETNVTLQRGGNEWTAPLEDIVDDSAKNIFLKAKDTVYLYREAKSFQAYGAVNVNGKYDFGKKDLTLAEAMGLARGMNDDKADPAEVYLYRLEHREMLQKIGIDMTELDSKNDTRIIPTVYKLDMRSGDGFFTAQEFAMQKGDILYIANAESVEFIKFLSIINPTSVTKINTNEALTE